MFALLRRVLGLSNDTEAVPERCDIARLEADCARAHVYRQQHPESRLAVHQANAALAASALEKEGDLLVGEASASDAQAAAWLEMRRENGFEDRSI